MKYAIFGILIAVLGFGEYVYVELAPWPPGRKMWRARQIPIVKDIVSEWHVIKYEKWSKAGNPWASAALYDEGEIRKDEELMARAKKRLFESDTDAARLSLYEISSVDQGDCWEVKWTVLVLLAGEENIPVPWISAEQNFRHKIGTEEWHGRIFEQAIKGEEHSQRIIAALEGEDVCRNPMLS